VTQGTLKVVGAFHGLSNAPAATPAGIRPSTRWSRGASTPGSSSRRRSRGCAGLLLRRANEVRQMMTVVGEEGVSLEDFTVALKADFFDNCYLQQNAFDDVDGATTAERQQFRVRQGAGGLELEFDFETRNRRGRRCVGHDLFRNWNYAASGSDEYERTGWADRPVRRREGKGRDMRKYFDAIQRIAGNVVTVGRPGSATTSWRSSVRRPGQIRWRR
jgi:V/A-type H+/Na+-transporting ATPase subunit A